MTRVSGETTRVSGQVVNARSAPATAPSPGKSGRDLYDQCLPLAPTRPPVVLYNFALITYIRSVCSLSLSPSISISVCLLAFTSVTGKALCKLKCVEPSAVQHGGICHAAAAELDAVSSSMSLVYAKLLRSITAVSAALLYLNEACHCRVLRHSVDLKLRPASRLYFLFMFLQAVTGYALCLHLVRPAVPLSDLMSACANVGSPAGTLTT